MKKKIREKADVKEFIKQETSPEKHSESPCLVRYTVAFAAIALFSSDDGDCTAQVSYGTSNFQNTLIEADTIDHRKSNSLFWRP
jgi:hypothetical protein